jgi:hypothetical protein
MKILIACESSCTVRDAFIAKGHDAWSCDFLPAEKGGNHFQCDVREVLGMGWDMMIGHPTCTFICNSGVRWLYTQEGRWEKMKEGAEFFAFLDQYEAIPRRAIENPIMHKHSLEIVGRKATQFVQPWWFGEGETKATGLWLTGLPPLQPTNIVDGRVARIHKMPPGPDRWKERSKTYQGIADAMAAQWG